ncbi:MAG: multiheme c-type cytochrome [Thermodesulfobacteriota bacterium]
MDGLRIFLWRLHTAKKTKLASACRGLMITAWLVLSIPVQPAWSEDPTSSSSWFVDMSRFLKSAHGSLTCERCHAEMTVKGKVHPNREDPTAMKKNVVRTYDYKRCASCHPEAYKRFLQGEHAKALEKEKLALQSEGKEPPPQKSAPTCGDCHSSHYVQAKRSRVELGTQMIETCGKCHKAQEASYLKDIHGRMGVFLETKASAYCTDCHGAHTCESLKDKQKALAACLRCHKDATIRFAGIVIHGGSADISKKDPEKQASIALVGTIKPIAQVCTIILLAFFALQTFVWILRELHRRLRGR